MIQPVPRYFIDEMRTRRKKIEKDFSEQPMSLLSVKFIEGMVAQLDYLIEFAESVDKVNNNMEMN